MGDETSTETREKMVQRHKGEQKSLMGTITGMKKQATKKTRKGVLCRCSELQASLDEKHRHEWQALDGFISNDEQVREIDPQTLLAQMEATTVNDSAEKEETGDGDTCDAHRPKRNRAKERLAKRNAKEDQVREEARKESENDVDYRKMEHDSMQQLIAQANLTVHEIKPDGHCLFASIRDQLSQRHSTDVPIQQLRDTAARYMEMHPDDFVPFLYDENTNTLRDLADYTTELTTTAMWGSDMEIMALANEYNCPITVLMAGAAPITINEDGTDPELRLAFFRHSFGLGEHYNSLRDVDST